MALQCGCEDYDPQGIPSEYLPNSCMHVCACGFSKYWGCWYNKCPSWDICYIDDDGFIHFDELKVEVKELK